MCGGGLSLRELALLEGRGGVAFGRVVIPLLVEIRGLMMMVRGGMMMRRRLVVVFRGEMFRREGQYRGSLSECAFVRSSDRTKQGEPAPSSPPAEHGWPTGFADMVVEWDRDEA